MAKRLLRKSQRRSIKAMARQAKKAGDATTYIVARWMLAQSNPVPPPHGVYHERNW